MYNYWIMGSLILVFLLLIGLTLKQASAEKDIRRLIPLEGSEDRSKVWTSNIVQTLALLTGTLSIAKFRADEKEAEQVALRGDLWTGMFEDYP